MNPKECYEANPWHITVIEQPRVRRDEREISKCPAALVELGFMSNQIDLAQLISPDYQFRQSYAIHLGLDAFGP
jgi:hypothetical protein